MGLTDINLFTLIYLAFRLAPFVMVSYFTIYSMFNRDFSSLIYLAGLLMACFFAILLGNSAPMSFYEGPADSFCHVVTLGTGEPISKLPLSIVTFVYTFAYFSVPIYKNNTQDQNIWFLVLFPVLILFDMVWLYIYGCAGLFSMVAAGVAGLTVALSWGEVVYSLDLQLPNSNKEQSSVTGMDPSKYLCLKGVETFVPSRKTPLQEGFGHGADALEDGAGVTCGVDPEGAPKHSKYRLQKSGGEDTLHVYPTTTIFSSWDATMKTTRVADCSEFVLGEDMALNDSSNHSKYGSQYEAKTGDFPDWYHPGDPKGQDTSSSSPSSPSSSSYAGPSSSYAGPSSSYAGPSPASSYEETSGKLYYSASSLAKQLEDIYMQWQAVLSDPLSSLTDSHKIYSAASSNITKTYLPQLTTLISTLQPGKQPKDKIKDPAAMQLYLTSMHKLMEYAQNDLANITQTQKPPLNPTVVDSLTKKYNAILGAYKKAIEPSTE